MIEAVCHILAVDESEARRPPRGLSDARRAELCRMFEQAADGRRILKRNGDRISTFDGNAWARSDAELPAYARSLLGFSAK